MYETSICSAGTDKGRRKGDDYLDHTPKSGCGDKHTFIRREASGQLRALAFHPVDHLLADFLSFLFKYLSGFLAATSASWVQAILLPQPPEPFYTVEIAPYSGYGGNGALLREQQHIVARRIANAACISTNDLAYDYEGRQIHPCQKRQVGQRLALTALNKTYGQWWLTCEGPTYKDMRIEGNKMILSFDNASGGFSRLDGIKGFEVAGEDRVFHPADSIVVGEEHTITLSSREVNHPIAARYCFHDFMIGNLAGAAGLPVVPFRTDKW